MMFCFSLFFLFFFETQKDEVKLFSHSVYTLREERSDIEATDEDEA